MGGDPKPNTNGQGQDVCRLRVALVRHGETDNNKREGSVSQLEFLKSWNPDP